MGFELFVGLLAATDILFAASMYVVYVKTATKDNVYVKVKEKV